MRLIFAIVLICMLALTLTFLNEVWKGLEPLPEPVGTVYFEVPQLLDSLNVELEPFGVMFELEGRGSNARFRAKEVR